MNVYDLVFIVKDERDEGVKNLQKSISDLKGKVTSQDTWGKKNFYFPIKKQTSGYYMQWSLEITRDSISELKKKLEYDENILRFLLLQTK